MIFAGSFSDFAKKARPHESIKNSSQIEGLALGKTTNKRPQNEGNTGMETTKKKEALLLNSGFILGAISIPFSL